MTLLRRVNILLLVPLLCVACTSPRAVNIAAPAASATSAPQSPDAFIYSNLTRGKYYLKIGNHTMALQEFKNAYNKLSPDSPASLRGIILNDLGEALIVSGNYKEAISVCHSALLFNLACKNKIEAAISHIHLGDAIEKSGNSTAAQKHWQIAYEMAAMMGHFGLIKTAESRPIAAH